MTTTTASITMTLCPNCGDFDATWEGQESLDYCPGATYYESWSTWYTCSNCGFEIA